MISNLKIKNKIMLIVAAGLVGLMVIVGISLLTLHSHTNGG